MLKIVLRQSQCIFLMAFLFYFILLSLITIYSLTIRVQHCCNRGIFGSGLVHIIAASPRTTALDADTYMFCAILLSSRYPSLSCFSWLAASFKVRAEYRLWTSGGVSPVPCKNIAEDYDLTIGYF